MLTRSLARSAAIVIAVACGNPGADSDPDDVVTVQPQPGPSYDLLQAGPYHSSRTIGVGSGAGPLVALYSGGRLFDDGGNRVPLDLANARAFVWTPTGARAWYTDPDDGPVREYVLEDGQWSGPTPAGDVPAYSPVVRTDGSMVAPAKWGPLISVDDGETWTFAIKENWANLRCVSDHHLAVGTDDGLSIYGLEGPLFVIPIDRGGRGCAITGQTLWLREQDNGPLVSFDLDTLTFSGRAVAVPDEGPMESLPTADGGAWLKAGAGLFSLKAGVVERVDRGSPPRDGYRGWTTRGDDLVLATDLGLHRYTSDGWLDFYDGQPVSEFVTNSSDQWLGIWRYGLVDDHEGVWSTGPRLPWRDPVVAVELASDGTVYAATDAHLAIVTAAETRTIELAGVQAMSVDSDDGLWVWTTDRLGRLNGDQIESRLEAPGSAWSGSGLVALSTGELLLWHADGHVDSLDPDSDNLVGTPYQGAIADRAGGAFVWGSDLRLVHLRADGSTDARGGLHAPPRWISWDGGLRLVVGTSSGIRVSADLGESWSPEIPDPGPIRWLESGEAHSLFSGSTYARR